MTPEEYQEHVRQARTTIAGAPQTFEISETFPGHWRAIAAGFVDYRAHYGHNDRHAGCEMREPSDHCGGCRRVDEISTALAAAFRAGLEFARRR